VPLPPKQFVALVAEALKSESPTDLAKAIKLGGYNAPQRVRRWMDGDHAPDYEGTMLMLEAAGMLNLEHPSPSEPPAGGRDDDQLLAEVRGLDRKIDTEVSARLERIEGELRELTRARGSRV